MTQNWISQAAYSMSSMYNVNIDTVSHRKLWIKIFNILVSSNFSMPIISLILSNTLSSTKSSIINYFFLHVTS